MNPSKKVSDNKMNCGHHCGVTKGDWKLTQHIVLSDWTPVEDDDKGGTLETRNRQIQSTTAKINPLKEGMNELKPKTDVPAKATQMAELQHSMNMSVKIQKPVWKSRDGYSAEQSKYGQWLASKHRIDVLNQVRGNTVNGWTQVGKGPMNVKQLGAWQSPKHNVLGGQTGATDSVRKVKVELPLKQYIKGKWQPSEDINVWNAMKTAYINTVTSRNRSSNEENQTGQWQPSKDINSWNEMKAVFINTGTSRNRTSTKENKTGQWQPSINARNPVKRWTAKFNEWKRKGSGSTRKTHISHWQPSQDVMAETWNPVKEYNWNQHGHVAKKEINIAEEHALTDASANDLAPTHIETVWNPTQKKTNQLNQVKQNVLNKWRLQKEHGNGLYPIGEDQQLANEPNQVILMDWNVGVQMRQSKNKSRDRRIKVHTKGLSGDRRIQVDSSGLSGDRRIHTVPSGLSRNTRIQTVPSGLNVDTRIQRDPSGLSRNTRIHTDPSGSSRDTRIKTDPKALIGNTKVQAETSGLSGINYAHSLTNREPLNSNVQNSYSKWILTMNSNEDGTKQPKGHLTQNYQKHRKQGEDQVNNYSLYRSIRDNFLKKYHWGDKRNELLLSSNPIVSLNNRKGIVWGHEQYFSPIQKVGKSHNDNKHVEQLNKVVENEVQTIQQSKLLPTLDDFESQHSSYNVNTWFDSKWPNGFIRYLVRGDKAADNVEHIERSTILKLTAHQNTEHHDNDDAQIEVSSKGQGLGDNIRQMNNVAHNENKMNPTISDSSSHKTILFKAHTDAGTTNKGQTLVNRKAHNRADINDKGQTLVNHKAHNKADINNKRQTLVNHKAYNRVGISNKDQTLVNHKAHNRAGISNKGQTLVKHKAHNRAGINNKGQTLVNHKAHNINNKGHILVDTKQNHLLKTRFIPILERRKLFNQYTEPDILPATGLKPPSDSLQISHHSATSSAKFILGNKKVVNQLQMHHILPSIGFFPRVPENVSNFNSTPYPLPSSYPGGTVIAGYH